MTETQYKSYSAIRKEIEPIKDFIFYCGDKYHKKGFPTYLFSLVKLAERIAVKFHSPTGGTETCELPKELRTEIIKVIEDYVARKEKELEEI